MNDKFEKCIKFVLEKEAGYVNHKNDRGGETKYGISKASYPDLDIKNLDVETAKAIYYKDYWITSGAHEHDFPLCLAVLDSAVHHGVGRVKGWLEKTQDYRKLLEYRVALFNDIVKKNPTQSVFFRGWMNRVNDLKKYVDIMMQET